MNPAEFDDQFNRLTGHFHFPSDADREMVAMDWLRAVERYHVDALEHAVTQLIRQATDRFWPPLGTLLEIIRGRIAGVEKTRGDKCARCHGSTWVEAWPMKTHEGHVYEFMGRCPDCGVPAPQGGTAYGLTALTKAEYQQFRAGDWQHPPMPDGMQAKPRPNGDPGLMRDAMDRLRVKLFGADQRTS